VTSSLDWESDRLVTKTIEKRRERLKGTLVISHRMQLAAGADQVLVLDKGRIEQQGSHEELLAAGGLYQRLWQLQRGDHKAAPEAAGVS